MPLILNRLFGAYLVLTAIAVALLFMITPLIHDGSPEYPNWTILNYFMAIGVILMLVLTFLYRWRLNPESTDNYTCAIANALFYGSVVLTMFFYWEYFWLLDTSSESGDAGLSHTIYFPLMDAIYVVLGLIIGERMLRSRGQE